LASNCVLIKIGENIMKCIEANVNIIVIEGGTFDRTYQWKTGVPPVPVDLEGFSAHMQIRAKLKDIDILLDVPFQDKEWEPDGDTGIYIPEADEYDDDLGKFRIYLRDNDTAGLCLAHKDIIGVYDLFLYNSYEEAILKLYGTATIQAAVTRTT
jgi:hypothetical protein